MSWGCSRDPRPPSPAFHPRLTPRVPHPRRLKGQGMLHREKQILFTCLLLSTVYLNTGYRVSMYICCRDFGKCRLEKESLYHLPQVASLFPLGAWRHQCFGKPWGTPCSHFGIWPVQECSDFEILLFNYGFYLQHKNLSISLLVFLRLNVSVFPCWLGP